MQKVHNIFYILFLLGVGLVASLCCHTIVEAGSLQDSPYIAFSPDGAAYTTNPGDQNCKWYEKGLEVDTGVKSTIRDLKQGEHYYSSYREGKLPVGKWKVAYATGICCHRCGMEEGTWYHGLTFEKDYCLASYYSGWFAYCADCGEVIDTFYTYMSQEAAATLGELDTALDYYYLCPFCTNLEQGIEVKGHYCKAISWNRYRIVYERNTQEQVGGYMENSFHMYDNQTIFEGKEVTASVRLHKNTYTRLGYVFQGWNTMPDGSGMCFEDQAEIWNLTDENYEESGKGTITLYAQWKRAESTVQIDPAGGTYEGSKEVVEVCGQYGTCYEPDEAKVIGPEGYTVFFDTTGGKELKPMMNKQLFFEWIPKQPMAGNFNEGKYEFTGADGAVDRICASYIHQPIVLPKPVKEGYSFGGWYYDEDCRVWAGKAGEDLIPNANITLYAKWVELLLTAENNDIANGGAGAVDLEWTQQDGQQKVYMLYQSEDSVTWNLVTSAEDGKTEQKRVDRVFSFSAKEHVYIVPYTGLYTLILNGAQGESYGEFHGGYGGRVTGVVWLEKGEELTYTIGGQNGFNGGGLGDSFGTGGGYSVVTSDRKGILMIAGGGGGATSVSHGGSGGSSAVNTAGGMNGESGEAGGGGGYFGGTSGQVVRHFHTEKCYKSIDTSTVIMSNSDYLSPWAKQFEQQKYAYYLWGGYHSDSKSIWGVRGHTKTESISGASIRLGEYFDDAGALHDYLIPVSGGQTLHIHIATGSWGNARGMDASSLTVWDQNDNILLQKDLDDLPRYGSLEALLAGTGGERGQVSGWCRFHTNKNISQVYWNESIVLPEHTTGVKLKMSSEFRYATVWMENFIQEISLEGNQNIQICPYTTEGQVIEANPSCGGNSYVNTEYITDYQMEKGVQQGDGSFELQSVKVGYQSAQFLKGVSAPDMEAPDPISINSVAKSAMDENTVQLSWQVPKDNGTTYYHMVESYLPAEAAVLSKSNITRNTLISGVKGFYYVLDRHADTKVNADNGIWLDSAQAQILVLDEKQFFHVAAIDKAGNIGETIHIEIGRTDEEITWPIWTDILQVISQNGAVYEANEKNTYYVRCDGTTPFMLYASGWIAGQASNEYQINHMQLHLQPAGGDAVVMDFAVPKETLIREGTQLVDASQIVRTLSGASPMEYDSYALVRRSNRCARLEMECRFLMAPSMDGNCMKVVPVAGLDFQGKQLTSDWDRDLQHGLNLIGDSQPPQISGTKELKDMLEGNLHQSGWKLFFTALDEGSGLKDFYVVIHNEDNGSRREIHSDGAVLEITYEDGDHLFAGSFVAEFHAVDQVGNEQIVICNSGDFAVTAHVERILSPHEPVFRCGESGILKIQTFGYVDKVEVTFPISMVEKDASLYMVREYGDEAERREEDFIFMIPLGMPLDQYPITVTAWKNDKVKSTTVFLYTLGEEKSVLQDLRTRLR